MEEHLRVWTDRLRSIGIPVETYMLTYEGRVWLKQRYPLLFMNETEEEFKEPFAFSCTWRIAFCERHHFSLRRITTKKKIMRNIGKIITTNGTSKESAEGCLQLCHEFIIVLGKPGGFFSERREVEDVGEDFVVGWDK